MGGAPAAIGTCRDLVAWQVGMELAEVAYGVTRRFDKAELYALTSQMRRAAVSVPANVAEGFGRGAKAQFRRFLQMARASLFELQTHAELARRLGWIKREPLVLLRDVAHRLDAVLAGLIGSVKRRQG
jgi:four helix bundle protein